MSSSSICYLLWSGLLVSLHFLLVDKSDSEPADSIQEHVYQAVLRYVRHRHKHDTTLFIVTPLFRSNLNTPTCRLSGLAAVAMKLLNKMISEIWLW